MVPQLQLVETTATPVRTQLLRATTIDKADPHLHKASAAEVLGVTIAFHFLFFMFLLSFFRSIITNSGSIPNTEKYREGKFGISKEDEKRMRELVRGPEPDLQDSFILRFLRLIPLVERKKTEKPKKKGEKTLPEQNPEKNEVGDRRACKFCKVYKPDRCHHCRICESCVLRMDHHCPWLGVCVGFHNYKFFLLTLLYAICSLIFILGDTFPRLINAFQPILDIKYFLTKDMVMVANAMTTIEYKEKLGREPFFPAAHSKFDYGYYQNWCHILGPPWMWLLPISPPGDNFVIMQYNYLNSLPRLQNEHSETARQALLKHLISKRTREEFAAEAGCYYTPLPENFELWRLSIDPDEKPSRGGRGAFRSSPVPGGDAYTPTTPSSPTFSSPPVKFTAIKKEDKNLSETPQQPQHPLGLGSLTSEEEGEDESDEEGGGDGVRLHGPAAESQSPIHEEEVATHEV
jgi:hypothetical protein